MHKKGSSAIYSLSSLLAKEKFRMKSYGMQQAVAFEQLDSASLEVPASAPKVEVWKADNSSFIDADMRLLFNEVVVVKIDAKLDAWNRLSKTEGQESISVRLAKSSSGENPEHTHMKLKQEGLRSFVSSKKEGYKVNKHLLAKDIGTGQTMAYLLKTRGKKAQNFALVSFGLSEAGKNAVRSWKQNATELEDSLRIQGRFESVAIIGDPMKSGSILVDPDDETQCVRLRRCGSMSSSLTSSGYYGSGNSVYDVEYERWSEGTQTTIVPGNNDDAYCVIEPPPVRRRRSRCYRSSETSSLSSSSSISSLLENDDNNMLRAKATDVSSSDLKCHSCGKTKDSNKHMNCHKCRYADEAPQRCHHHTYHSGCSYCRWRRARVPDDYEARIAKMREQDAKDRMNYIAKISHIEAKKAESTALALRPGGPRPATHNKETSDCGPCAIDRGGSCAVKPAGGSCAVKPSGCGDGGCSVAPSVCQVEPSCPSPCDPEPTYEIVCETPCRPACPPPTPDCWYFEEEETSSSSDDFYKLIEDKNPNQSKEDEDEPQQLFGVDTLTETGHKMTAAEEQDTELRRFAESVIENNQEMASFWGGKKNLVVTTLDPVFEGDTIVSLGNDRSYTAQLALQMANSPLKGPDLDVGTLQSKGTTLKNSRVQILAKREGTGIFTRLKNLFAKSILNRRLDERLAPIRDNSGTIRRGVRVFDNINRASTASGVPTKEAFLEKKKIITRSGTSTPAYSGSSFQINVQFPSGKAKQEMYFVRMDTDTPTRGRASSRRMGSAITGNVWYRPESKTRVGIILQFTRTVDPSRSVLKSMYLVYSDTLMKTRDYVPTFEAADGVNDRDAIDADGDGEFDIADGSE